MWNFSNDKDVSKGSLIPEGIYNVAVDGVEVRKTKRGDDMLVLTFKIVEENNFGRKVFQNYMMTGNEKAMEIARGQLKALLKCAGKPLELNGPEDFYGCVVGASIKIKKEDGYPDRNIINYFTQKSTSVSTPADDLNELPF